MKKYPEIGSEYLHYKGGKYSVISLYRHTTTDEELVIYKSIHFGTVYARPLSEWFDEIVISNDSEFSMKTQRFVISK